MAGGIGDGIIREDRMRINETTFFSYGEIAHDIVKGYLDERGSMKPCGVLRTDILLFNGERAVLEEIANLMMKDSRLIEGRVLVAIQDSEDDVLDSKSKDSYYSVDVRRLYGQNIVNGS